MPMSMRCLFGGLGMLCAAAGCGEKYNMVTVALMTEPETTMMVTATMTEGTEGTTAETPTTSDSQEGSNSDANDTDPTAPTTGTPVPCEDPESCTAEEEGDVMAQAIPFFRGKVCVSDEVQPGDKVAVSVSTCFHPCMDPGGYKYKWVYRYTAEGFELALVFYHPDSSGESCPADVFGEFDPAACEFTEEVKFAIGPVVQGDEDWVGPATLLVPFFTNADAAAFNNGDDGAAAVWDRIGTHAQAMDRIFPMSFDGGNPTAPAECGEGVSGCTCRAIGL